MVSDERLQPTPDDPRLTEPVRGIDQDGNPVNVRVVVERPLTLFLNGQEIVTMMTIGDYPDYLAVGYLANQNMLLPGDAITGIDHDEDLGVVVVRTDRETDYEARLKKKTLTSGCAQGTVFGDLMGSSRGSNSRPTPSCGRRGFMNSPGRSTPRPASISPPARFMVASCANGTSP